MLYSFNSFASARALPFNKSLWASAGGAFGTAASWALMAAIVSVGWTVIVYDADGFVDLNVTEIVAEDSWPQ